MLKRAIENLNLTVATIPLEQSHPLACVDGRMGAKPDMRVAHNFDVIAANRGWTFHNECHRRAAMENLESVCINVAKKLTSGMIDRENVSFEHVDRLSTSWLGFHCAILVDGVTTSNTPSPMRWSLRTLEKYIDDEICDALAHHHGRANWLGRYKM